MLTALDDGTLAQRAAPPAGVQRADAGGAVADLDAAKLLVTSQALRLRRAHPDWFTGEYQQLQASGAAAAHVVAFSRSRRAVTVATGFLAGCAGPVAGGTRCSQCHRATGRTWSPAPNSAPPGAPAGASGWLTCRQPCR